ncbi:MAG: hypothetical protein KKF54_01510 [Candidatus Omnitrophica bacterium]|nr:hypothetical protein [Candidatus Omnitrophota bacterium]
MNENICYLCGNSITDNLNYDHVPPRQFYAKLIRRNNNLNLLTLSTHIECNKAYQFDEDYFIHSIGPLAAETFSGAALWKDITSQFKRDEGKRIREKVYKEFEPNPSGLILPYNKVVKKIDPLRVWRIVWKIARGLFFKEYGRILSENTPRKFKIFSPGEKIPEEFPYVRDTPSKGNYPGVFDYKYICVKELNNFHVWAMLFWDKLIFIIAFHDPECPCEQCKNGL